MTRNQFRALFYMAFAAVSLIIALGNDLNGNKVLFTGMMVLAGVAIGCSFAHYLRAEREFDHDR